MSRAPLAEGSLYFRCRIRLCFAGTNGVRGSSAAESTSSSRIRRPIIPADLAHRVPPGQVIASRWPVLHQGDIPPFDPAAWDFRVWGWSMPR